MIQVVLRHFKFLSLLFVAIFASTPSWAGRETGNGGNALVCTTSGASESTIGFFDYVEAKILDPNFKLSLGGDELSVEQKVDLALGRLSRFAADKSRNYKATIKKILEGGSLVNGNLTPVNDSANVVVPAHCHLEQLALKINPEVDPYRRVWVINKDLYEKLDNNGRAGILLHEAIYAELISLGFSNSAGARFFNAVISSNKLDSMTPQDFVQILFQAGMQSFEYRGTTITLFLDVPFTSSHRYLAPSFYKDGDIQNAQIKWATPIVLGSGQSVLAGGAVTFYDGKGVQSFHPLEILSANGKTAEFDIIDLDQNQNIISGKTF